MWDEVLNVTAFWCCPFVLFFCSRSTFPSFTLNMTAWYFFFSGLLISWGLVPRFCIGVIPWCLFAMRRCFCVRNAAFSLLSNDFVFFCFGIMGVFSELFSSVYVRSWFFYISVLTFIWWSGCGEYGANVGYNAMIGLFAGGWGSWYVVFAGPFCMGSSCFV